MVSRLAWSWSLKEVDPQSDIFFREWHDPAYFGLVRYVLGCSEKGMIEQIPRVLAWSLITGIFR